MSLADALTTLQAQVGQEVHVSDWLTITQEMVNTFADATLDHQWIHINVARANAESPFGGPIAHGFLTLSLIPYLTGEVDPDKPRYAGLKMGINYGVNKVRFPHPVRVGARVRARVTLQSVAEAKGALQLVNMVTIEIDGVNKPGCVAEMVSLLYF
ncbi:MAG: MaoC family dehydratase [Anaerolineae bacterium]|nr:MaoC family dehydratase [Anaerolineae bacterium]